MTCTIGLHPRDSTGRPTCNCGGYAAKQCCDQRPRSGAYGPCKLHKCGIRKGCQCPAPEAT